MSWQAFLYLAIAAVGPRLLFRLIGRWLQPISRAEVPADPGHAPARPPLGDYRAS